MGASWRRWGKFCSRGEDLAGEMDLGVRVRACERAVPIRKGRLTIDPGLAAQKRRSIHAAIGFPSWSSARCSYEDQTVAAVHGPRVALQGLISRKTSPGGVCSFSVRQGSLREGIYP